MALTIRQKPTVAAPAPTRHAPPDRAAHLLDLGEALLELPPVAVLVVATREVDACSACPELDPFDPGPGVAWVCWCTERWIYRDPVGVCCLAREVRGQLARARDHTGRRRVWVEVPEVPAVPAVPR